MFKTELMDLTLRSIELEKFKCFNSAQKIDFGKITLITGANSSGKSSLLYSILGALQTHDFPYLFSPNGKYINMGDFKEIAYNHIKNRKIKLSYSFYSKQDNITFNVITEWQENKINKLPELSTLSVSTEYFIFKIRKDKQYLVDFSYDPLKDPDATASKQKSYKQFMAVINKTIDSKRKTESKKGNKKEDDLDLVKYADTLYKKYSCKNKKFASINAIRADIGKSNSRLNQTSITIPRIFSEFDNKINFISSFRLHPDRTYLEKFGSDKVKTFGQGYLDQLIKWESSNQKRFNEIVSAMKQLDLLETIKTNRIGGGRYEIVIGQKNSKLMTALTDVGFGISQFLPILIADAQLPVASILFIAQPEIHLHPSAQASFGDYIYGKVTSTEKRYVIETHSEYLINRLRARISDPKSKLKPEDIKLYFIENKDNDLTIHNIKLLKNGKMEGAPKSFFDTYFMDIKDIALNSFE